MRAFAISATAFGLVGMAGLAAAAPALSASTLPVTPCSQQSGLQLAVGVTLTCSSSTASGGAGATFPAHVVTLDMTAGPTLDVAPANGVVWQTSATVTTPDAPVSAMLPTDAAVAVNGGYFDIRSSSSYTGTACGGMVTSGRVLKTPARTAQGLANLVQYDDGSIYLGAVGFTGSITPTSAGPPALALTSINDLADTGSQQRCPPDLEGDNQAAGTGVTLVTPDMGAVVLPPTTGNAVFQIPGAIVVSGVRSGNRMTVNAVRQYTDIEPLTSLPALTGQQVDLVTSAPANVAWLTANATPGSTLDVSGALTVASRPRTDIRTLVGGGTMLVADQQVCPVTNDPPTTPGCGGSFPLGDGGPTSPHQETMIGTSADGSHTWVVTVDQLSDTDGGIAPVQDGAYMLTQLGAANAVLFDGGGSTTMVGRTTPTAAATLFSAPYYKAQDPTGPDNQRYVANAIVVHGGLAPPTPPAAGPSPARGEPVLAATGPGPLTALTTVGIALVVAGAATARWSRRRPASRRQSNRSGDQVRHVREQEASAPWA